MEKRDFTTFVFLFVVVFVFAPRDAVFAQTWSAQTSGTTDALMGVHFVNETTGWAVSNVATIFATTNGGSTWSAQTSGTTNPLFAVYFASASIGWAVGANGTILSTTNGGSTWSAQTSGTSQSLRDVYFIDTSTGWAVGNSGTILSTTNGGSTWSAQTSGTTEILQGVYFASATTGWAVGNAGTILSTTNGGSTWSAQTSGTTDTLNDVYFINDSTGWVVGGETKPSSSVILSTTNGGSTWSAQTSGTANPLFAVSFASASTGWAVGDAGTILSTTNGGSTWSAQTSGTTDTLNDVYFINDSTGWVVGDAGTILKFTGAASSNASSGGAGNSIFVRDIHARFAREYASRAYVPKNLNLRAERCTPDVCDIIIRFNAPEDAALERFMLRHGYNKQRIAFVGQREGGAFTARFEWSANAELPVELCYLNVNNSEFCSESRIWTPAAIDPNDVKIEQLRLVGDQRLITVQVPAFHNFSYLAAGRSLVLVEILDEDGKLVFLQSAIRPEKIQLRLDPRSYTLRLTPQNAAGDAGETITIPLDVFLLAEEERQTFMFRTDALWNMIFGMLADMLKGLMK